MSSSWNQVQEAKSGVSFFTSLRRLCREVDQGVKDIQSKLDVHGLHSGDINRHLALKGLLDRKKDIDTVKVTSLLPLFLLHVSACQSAALTCEVPDSQSCLKCLDNMTESVFYLFLVASSVSGLNQCI